jgi:hypothetical protein
MEVPITPGIEKSSSRRWKDHHPGIGRIVIPAGSWPGSMMNATHTLLRGMDIPVRFSDQGGSPIRAVFMGNVVILRFLQTDAVLRPRRSGKTGKSYRNMYAMRR